jgi:hypothetical protein
VGAKFSECHCRANHAVVTHRLLATSYRQRGVISVSVFRGETLAFVGQHGPILSGEHRVGVDEPGVLSRLYLVTATDPFGWTVIYPNPPVWRVDEFDPVVKRLQCDAVFGFYSEQTGMSSWAEYSAGKRDGCCSYMEPGVWFRNGDVKGAGECPPDEFRLENVFAARGREFTHRAFHWVIADVCKPPVECRPPYKLIEVRERYINSKVATGSDNFET